jgi:hypothetical protein
MDKQPLIYINTGDNRKCRVYHFQECPACRERYEFTDGDYRYSEKLKASIHVCPVHTGKTLTPEEDACVVNSYLMAMKNDRGRVSLDGKTLNKKRLQSFYLKLTGYKQ